MRIPLTYEARLRLINRTAIKVHDYERTDSGDTERAFKELLTFIHEHSNEQPMTAEQIDKLNSCEGC